MNEEDLPEDAAVRRSPPALTPGAAQSFAASGHALVPGLATGAEVARLVASEQLHEHTYGALRAGDATFHAGWTLHCAGPHPTDRMRPVMTVIYFADGARVSEPDSAYQRFDLSVWLPGRSAGDLAASPINPRLWPTSDSPETIEP